MTKMKQEVLKELVEINDNRETILNVRSRGGKRGANICDIWITDPELLNALECVALNYYESKAETLQMELINQATADVKTAPSKASSAKVA